MKSDAGKSESLWNEVRAQVAPLREDRVVDACVIGAGIAGLSTAYMLLRSGKTVIVLDDGVPGGGETGRTTAHLASAIDDGFVQIERIHGAQGARLAAESHAAAISRIESIVQQEKIACDFERLDGYLFLGPGDDPKLLSDERTAALRAGLDVVLVERAPAGFDTGPALRFPNQAQFDPMRYLAGLLRAIRSYGGEVFGGTHVAEVISGAPVRVRTSLGNVVAAHHVVVATNTPVNDRVALHTKQVPYRTYAIAARAPAGTVAPALYWDTKDPYHYVRRRGGDRADADLLIIGGEDHRTGEQPEGDPWTKLEEWARARWPQLGAVEHRWSGQVLETNDGLAFIGQNPLDSANVWVATGDSGMGMTHGTIAGMLLSDLITGRVNAWTALYDPGRVRAGAFGEWLKNNLATAGSYARWLTGGDVSSVDEIPRGQGAILRRGLSKIAVYRDDAGRLFQMSAVCPHLGGIVGWNDQEKTWDCPSHGSRFQATGGVVNGPANCGLSPYEEPAGEPVDAGRKP